ncbi:hypothetical protein EQH57_0088 [Dictyocoela roeselum]|nr:hypothetical protein EQH57_0088 [Dictyocoela roeselum]
MISAVCKECIDCNKEKDYTASKYVPSYDDWAYDKNEVVGIDIKGPIKLSNFENNLIGDEFYILVMMDLFSRYVEVDFISEISSGTICKSFENTWLKSYETHQKCLSDNGKQFTSTNFGNLLKKYNIKHITSAPYNPTGNSLVERVNREIGVVLRQMRNKGLNKKKKKYLEKVKLHDQLKYGSHSI